MAFLHSSTFVSACSSTFVSASHSSQSTLENGLKPLERLVKGLKALERLVKPLKV